MPDGVMGRYTGDMIRANDPAKYDNVVRAIAQGVSDKGVADRYNIHRSTVRAVRLTNPDLIKAAKAILALKFTEVANRGIEEAQARLDDDPDQIPYNQLVLGAAIAIDKALLLQGEATERIEHVIRVEDDEFDMIIRGAKRIQPADVQHIASTLNGLDSAKEQPDTIPDRLSRDSDTGDNTSIPPHPDTLKANNEDNWQ